jgi:hypothetical protein
MVVHSGIHVFVNTRKVRLTSNEIKASELVKLAGFFEHNHWDLYRLQNERDMTGTIVAANDTLRVKDGDFFRVVEGHHSSE